MRPHVRGRVATLSGNWYAICMTFRGTNIRVFLFASLVAAGSAAFAGRIVVPAFPASIFADTEVSTNIVMHGHRDDTWKVDLHIQLAGTPTTDLEVAFGRDINTNGVLDVDEIETMYGWRGGRYFVENVPAWERIEAEATVNALCGVCDIHLENVTRPQFQGVLRPFAGAWRRSRSWRQHRLRPGSSARGGTWFA